MSCFALSVVVMLGCTAYAIVRYTVFGDVSPQQLPLYVMNKGFSFAGLILLGCSRCASEPVRRRDLGYVGLGLILLHGIMSLCLLNPGYFPKLFQVSGLMTWQAEGSLLAGALSSLALCGLFCLSRTRDSQPAPPGDEALRPWLGRAMLLLAAVHVGLIGYAGWFHPDTWPGGLPPITLLSVLAAMAAVLWRRR